jgi:hypothetical protein
VRIGHFRLFLPLTGGIAINVFYVLFKAADNFKSFQEGLELYVILPYD